MRFSVRGAAGMHAVTAMDAKGHVLACGLFRLKPQTQLSCNKGPKRKFSPALSPAIIY